MRTSSILIFPLTAALLVLIPWIAFAQDCGGAYTSIVDKYKEETRDAELKMTEAKQVLLSKAEKDWNDSDIETYLYWSLWVVYNGTMAYVLDGYRPVPEDLTMLETQGYILMWPENPFNDWQPMQVTDDTSEFIPGGFCIQTAPDGHRNNRSFASFQLCIFGPDENFGFLGNAEVLEMNNTWAIVPIGALYMLGMA